MENNDTICAIATPDGVGGVAVIRISGEGCVRAMSQLLKTDAAKFESRKMYCATAYADGFADNCLAVLFRAPSSYTGEDVGEIHCHGGRALTRGILNALLKGGTRLAQNGEFTKRAFLNGKLTLAEGEGVADMINAESRAELNASYAELSGKLTKKILRIQERLTDLISGIEVAIDYPDEDVDGGAVKADLLGISQELSGLEESYSAGRSIRGGVNVGIVGLTNVGKSSLLNALLCYDRAIVTDIPGTTRDTVTESIEIGGVRFNLTDTAGIRESQDEVEKIGVQKSRDLLKSLDLVLFVTDGSDRDFIGEQEIARGANGRPRIRVFNKSDKPGFACEKAEQTDELAAVCISAKTGEGIAELKKAMLEAVKLHDISERGVILLSERHYGAVRRARELADAAAKSDLQMLDIAALHLKGIWDALGEITGTTATESIIDNIFSKFCLGK